MMATYFNGGSEIQADHLQTLYLMNPSYAATYSDAHQHLVGIPLAQSGSGTPGADLSRPSSFHEIQGSAFTGGPRFHYNLWGTADPSCSGGGAHNQITTAFSVSELGSPMGFRGPSKQGLSLSLNNSSLAGAVLSPGGGGTLTSASGVSVGVGGSPAPQSVILGSKYLKATQELLDEVVSMADSGASGARMEKAKVEIASDEDGASNGSVKKGGGVCDELSSAQRQELQMKKAKLLNMLDEVEQRYKQYQMQMHRVGSALEQAAGAGSAESYTSLALHTISKQFRCLKDAIASQVTETGKRMGEEEDEKEGGKTSTRLIRTVEQQLRQQRAMQQLGMMHNQHIAWRPQRGLPDRAVSVLRAWLFEHFLHPYPKDSDKHTLAKQTGLTRSQVSNWFINARVRLWKPMVEEMYVEEMKDAGHHQNDSGEANTTTTTTNDHMSKPKSPPPPPNNSFIPNSTLVSPSSGPTLHTTGPGFSLIGSSSSGMESILIQRSPKRKRNAVLDIHSPSSILSMDMKDDPGNNRDHLFTTPDGGFGPNNYPVADHIRSRFNSDHHHHHHQLGQSQYHHHHARNAVSLTLGLPHCENMLSLSGAHHHQQGQAMQLGRRLDMGEPEWCGSQPGPYSGAGGGGYEGSVDMQTGKRFAAQLLPDFVA